MLGQYILKLKFNRRKSALAAMLINLAVFVNICADEPTPSEKIDHFHNTLIDGMGMADDLEARLTRLTPEITSLFDIKTISRISLGRTWRTLSPTDQETFMELLKELITTTYAARFDTYNDQIFRNISSQPARNGVVVKTEIERSNGERVQLDYYFRDAFAYNVVADGVSDLSLRRAAYNAIIKQEGFDSLLSHIEKNIETQRANY